jgi:hypothetical protein
MAKAKRGIDERHLKGIIQGMGACFFDAALARMVKAIHEGKPIRPPDDQGWDIGAMFLTARVLVTRATALVGETSVTGHARECHRRRGGGRVEKKT